MKPEKYIRVKAMCLFIHDGKVLIQSGNSLRKRDAERSRSIIPGDYFRVLGGSLNVFETAEQGVKREIKEELGSDIENLQFLQVVESIFTYWGEKNHEIVFLYKGDLVNKDLYKKDVIHIVEDAYEFDAMWVPIEKIINKEVPLFPATDYSQYLP